MTDDLTSEEALAAATTALEQGPLAQMGIVIQTPDAIRVRMASRLIDATTLDDLLDENGTASWGDHEGLSVLIKSVSYAPSKKRGGLGFYAVVEAVDVENERPLTLTTGSENVLIQLARMVQKKWLDVPVALKSNVTDDGNTVHRLIKGTAGAKPPF